MIGPTAAKELIQNFELDLWWLAIVWKGQPYQARGPQERLSVDEAHAHDAGHVDVGHRGAVGQIRTGLARWVAHFWT